MNKLKIGNQIMGDNKEIKILKDNQPFFTCQKKNARDGLILDFSESN